MWFAIRHLRHSPVRSALFIGLVALVGALVLILTGLGLGLGNASVSGLKRLPVDAYVYQSDVRLFLARSTVPTETTEVVTATEAAESAEPFGVFTVSGRTAPGTDPYDIALTGVQPGSSLLPDGATLAGDDTAWADTTLADAGVAVGDTLTLEPSRQQVRIAGFVDAGTYSHLPMVYVPLTTWQTVKFGPVDGVGEVPESAFGQASAIAVTLAEGASTDDLSAELAGTDGIDVVTPSEAIAATPGYKEETGTVNLMVFFLYLIGALIVGTFFWNATVTRTSELAVLRAIGATPGRLAREHLSEVGIVSLIGMVIAALLSIGLAAMLPTGVPFLLPTSTVVSTSLVLLVVALLAGAVSLRRASRIDPLLALVRNL
jgi:putative ABC transport system permease protein